jgi:hypothetical protein
MPRSKEVGLYLYFQTRLHDVEHRGIFTLRNKVRLFVASKCNINCSICIEKIFLANMRYYSGIFFERLRKLSEDLPE